MLKIRVALFFDDVGNAKKQLEDARRLAADGGDWDRNNRLSAYESAYLIVTRDLKGAAKKAMMLGTHAFPQDVVFVDKGQPALYDALAAGNEECEFDYPVARPQRP